MHRSVRVSSLRRFGYGAAAVIAVAYLWLAWQGPRGFGALVDKRRHIQDLQEQNANLAREVEMRKDRIRKLERDRAEQDRIIRERLKLQRPGETTFIVPAPPETDAHP